MPTPMTGANTEASDARQRTGSPLGFGVAIFDLDGVLRRFDRTRVSMVEQQHALEPGSLQRTAFEADLLEPVVTGRCTHEQWIDAIGERLGNRAAVVTWMADRGAIDSETLAIVRGLRSGGLPIALLTNGTDWVSRDLIDLGLRPHLDHVFNSCEMGVAKPDPRIFRQVCAQLSVTPDQALFVDDREQNVAAAAAAGLRALHFTSTTSLRGQLAALNLWWA